MTNKIKVCLSPALFDIYSDRKSIVVVVDILRATSAMCVAFDRGVEKIIPVSTVEEALDYKGKKDVILAAERNGKIVSGFDYGNSPLSFLKEDFSGKSLVVTTTNGTKAINIAKIDHEVVIGSFLNIDVLSEYLIKKNKDIIILCAGWKNDFCIEDTMFAGALTEKLISSKKYDADFDSVNVSKLIYNSAKQDIFAFLKNSQHRIRLADLNIEDDVRFCLKSNQTNNIPYYNKGYLSLI
jgi:2-phosphosulfolactate phosphatase